MRIEAKRQNSFRKEKGLVEKEATVRSFKKEVTKFGQ